MTLSITAGRVHVPKPEGPQAPVGPRLASIPPETARSRRLPTGATGHAAAELESLFTHPRRLARRSVLYRTGDPFNALHVVRVGSLKSVALVDDGREQITGYAMAGDIVGLEGLGVPVHTCDVVALEETEVGHLPFERLDEATRDPAVAQVLLQLLANDLRRIREMTVLLGSLRAHERVATFLLDLARRHHERGYSGTELVLRMTREEIASFLGLKLETVSRTFSRLHAGGLIEVQGRAVRILDGHRLGGLGVHGCDVPASPVLDGPLT